MNKIFLISILLISTFAAFGQKTPQVASLDTLPVIELATVQNEAFTAGEYLKFVLHYGIIDAGEAELTVNHAGKKYMGRSAYHIVGTGKTLGAFNWFFKVRDRYETFLDAQGIFPWQFVRDIREGGYEKKQEYAFYQHKAAVKTNKGKTYKIPPFSQDMLSSFYYARTFDFSNAQYGQVYTIPTFVDDEEYPLQIKFIGREEVKVRSGTYKCLKFVPVVQEGRIFKEEEDMTVWITDDKNKILILAQAKVLVGSIKMELVDYKNLANPISIVSN
ncbi:DUF3108 domain-containing protein [Cryomorpha ignava]|uniref:DUF3108 domain-containing protein n=1 Tax=Cryomorpha ignava TaxID=101383 RepID=A0A7K3WSV9_9FLAO|nr:DUF3108 domain-containing protein [Cryomorpha ignava]NEN24574.1 DUF3108 domain-containing protein [Cryomorpha ignava]